MSKYYICNGSTLRPAGYDVEPLFGTEHLTTLPLAHAIGLEAENMKHLIAKSMPDPSAPTIDFPLTKDDATLLIHIRSGLIELARDSLYLRNEHNIIDLVEAVDTIDRLLHERTPPLVAYQHD